MISFLRRLLGRRLLNLTRQDIEWMDTERLRAVHATDRCRRDPELLVAVWSELALRERFADEAAITVNIRPPEAKPAEE